ncbi:MAG: anti-sigma factor [Anaerolineae bacterium]|nr:anti-sigma factor [Anaerolineae bacterium]
MKLIKWLILALVNLLLLALVALPVLANGVPKTIYLNYSPEFSNSGSEAAHGEAVVAVAEQWIELKAEGLPQLADGEMYQAWIVQAETGEMVSLGTFNADAAGQVNYSADLVDVPNVDYRYMVISIEPANDSDPAADERRVIAGVFPNAQLQPVVGTATPTLAPGVTPTPGPPVNLPQTGGENAGFWHWDIASVIVGFGLGLVITLLFSLGFNHKETG